MKTVTNSSGKAIIVTESNEELMLIVNGLQFQEIALNKRITALREDINSFNMLTGDKGDYELWILYEKEACEKRKQNYELYRKLEQITRGYVDLEISPYILTTDLTTLRGWL